MHYRRFGLFVSLLASLAGAQCTECEFSPATGEVAAFEGNRGAVWLVQPYTLHAFRYIGSPERVPVFAAPAHADWDEA